MQNIQECLTGLWPATGASSRSTARFAVIISTSLTAGFTTSVDMDKTDLKKKSRIFRALSRIFFFRSLTCLTLLPVIWDLAIMDYHSSKIADYGSTCITCCLDHLHHYTWWTCSFARLHLWDGLFTMSIVIGIGGPSNSGSLDRWSGSQSNSTLRSLS